MYQPADASRPKLAATRERDGRAPYNADRPESRRFQAPSDLHHLGEPDAPFVRGYSCRPRHAGDERKFSKPERFVPCLRVDVTDRLPVEAGHRHRMCPELARTRIP